MLDRRRDNAGERHSPLTGMERRINVVIRFHPEQPVSHPEQDTGIQNESLLPGNKRFFLRPRQDSGYEDQEGQDRERKKEKIGPQKEAYEKGNNAGENKVGKAPY